MGNDKFRTKNAAAGRFLIFLAILVGLLGGSRMLSKLESWQWTPVTAEVIKSEIHKRSGRRADWCVKMTYSYNVRGKTFIGDRIAPSRISNSGCSPAENVAMKNIQKFYSGAKIRAYFNEKDPHKSALVLDGLDVLDYFLTLLFATLLIVGMAALRR